MRIKFIDKDGSIVVTTVETFCYDKDTYELIFFEFGSTEGDYIFEVNTYYAALICAKLLEFGYCDLYDYHCKLCDKTCFDQEDGEYCYSSN